MKPRAGELLLGATRSARGRVGRIRRHFTPFLALVETPPELEITGHTGKVARFAGWIGSSEPGPHRVSVAVDGRPATEHAVDIPRPDVLERYRRKDMVHALGFSVYVDLEGLALPVDVRLELTDGRHSVRTAAYRILAENNILHLDTYTGDPPVLRELAAKHFRGRGLELGALHAPVDVGPSCEMEYADKRTRAESYELFYDMREEYGDAMVEVDHILDLDRDDLSELEPLGYDFVVCAGVIEHLVNPLRFLERLHRVMKPGAKLMLTAPDRDFTWDVSRPLTANEHLLDEYERGETELSEEHLVEYIEAVPLLPLAAEGQARTDLLEFHRERSIHVHVWDERSFGDFLRFANERVGLTFEVIDHASSQEGTGNVVYLLRKPPISELLFPTERADGTPLTVEERDAPAFAALVEVPRRTDVHTHTGKHARIKGWMAGRDTDGWRLRIRLGDAEPVEGSLDTPFPDVGLVMAWAYGMEFAREFSFYVDLPQLEEPLRAELELTDGRSVLRMRYRFMPDRDIYDLDTFPADSPAIEALARRQLRGKGLELGALHAPLEVDPSCEMHYADKWSKEDSKDVYFDMRDDYGDDMMDVDHIVDLDRDELTALEPFGYDFFIAAEVIEHLVNPLRFLVRLHRVMRPGALLLLTVPDRDFSFDCERELTTVEHVLDEYHRGEEELSEAHVIEYIEAFPMFPWTEEEPSRSHLLKFHRDRSIHVHVWTDESFAELLRVASADLGVTFEIVDHVATRDALGRFAYLLRKA